MFLPRRTIEIADLRIDCCSLDGFVPQICFSELLSSVNCLPDLFKVPFTQLGALRMKGLSLLASLVKLQEVNFWFGLKKIISSSLVQ